MNLIVVGADESPGSCRAVLWAADLAVRLGAAIIAVHAFEPLDHLAEVQPDTDLTDVRDSIHEQLVHEWCGGLATAGVDFEAVIEEGRPADVLVAVARDRDAGLIVLGARRMGWLKALALGSTSHRVLHEAQCPVVIVHDRTPE
jgi:nucleotide-binding universal stress UspA family protein